MVLQRLGERDGPRLREVRLRALRDAPEAFGSTLEETIARPPEVWDTQVKSMPTWVAVEEADDVGMVRCAADANRPDALLLLSLWVAPRVRGRGVGDALVEAVVAHARDAGARRVGLDVAEGNAHAIALYRRCGFAPTGETGSAPAPHEAIEESWELRLGEPLR